MKDLSIPAAEPFFNVSGSMALPVFARSLGRNQIQSAHELQVVVKPSPQAPRHCQINQQQNEPSALSSSDDGGFLPSGRTL